MLSRHPERCKYPHGHTRTIEVVVSGDELNENGMLLDFKALKLAVQDHIERYDHALAVNSADPFLPALLGNYPPEAVIVFENTEPTTEVIAKDIFDHVSNVLSGGFQSGPYEIRANSVHLERVRVWETPSSWAEYGL
jgi:6-pyruvoyltetrahydropterin/6-carboxytetrahydropterin synthase